MQIRQSSIPWIQLDFLYVIWGLYLKRMAVESILLQFVVGHSVYALDSLFKCFFTGIATYQITIGQIWVHQTVIEGFEMLISQYMSNGIHDIYGHICHAIFSFCMNLYDAPI